MIATKREYYRRVHENSEVEAVINMLLQDGWDIIDAPEQVDSHVEHLREKVEESDLVIRIAELGKAGWEQFEYGAPDDELRDSEYTLSAWRTSRTFFRITAARSVQVSV